MIIYRTVYKYKNIPGNTLLKFNKSYQRFESFCRKMFITNDESYHNPHLIVIDHEIFPTNTQKSKDWNPFAKWDK